MNPADKNTNFSVED
jgi:hypothetical protein